MGGPCVVTHLNQNTRNRMASIWQCFTLKNGHQKVIMYYNEIGPCAQIYNNHSTFISEQRWERLYDILKRKRIFTLDSYNFCVFNGVASKTIHESLCESRFGNWVRDFPADPTVIKCV